MGATAGFTDVRIHIGRAPWGAPAMPYSDIGSDPGSVVTRSAPHSFDGV